MSDDTKPTTEAKDAPEVEAHAVLDLQGIELDEAQAGLASPGSCSSCVGSLCM